MSAIADAMSPELSAAADRRRRIVAIIGASSGNLVEWYDFYA
jgi:MFS transporter, MHS family, alpha-ketoglutarate permease